MNTQPQVNPDFNLQLIERGTEIVGAFLILMALLDHTVTTLVIATCLLVISTGAMVYRRSRHLAHYKQEALILFLAGSLSAAVVFCGIAVMMQSWLLAGIGAVAFAAAFSVGITAFVQKHRAGERGE